MFFPSGRKFFEPKTIKSFISSMVSLHQVLSCATHVFFPLLQFWRCAPEREKMLDGLRRCLKSQRSCALPRHHDEGTPASIQLKNLLPRNTMEIYNYSQYLLIAEKTPVTIWLSSLSAYTMSRCKMHLEVFTPTDSIVSVWDLVYTSKFYSSYSAA